MTRLVASSCLAVALAASSACLQPSLNPLITAAEAIFDPVLVGTWACADEMWTFARGEDDKPHYLVRIVEADETVALKALTGRLGGDRFIDFVPEDGPDATNKFFWRHVVVTHSFGRVSVDGDILRLRMLEMEWAQTYGESRGPAFGQTIDDIFVLTAPSVELRRLAIDHAQDQEAFPVQVELTRAPADPASGTCYEER